MRIYRLSKVYGHTFSCTFSEVKNCFNPVYEEGEKKLGKFCITHDNAKLGKCKFNKSVANSKILLVCNQQDY